MGVTRDHVLRAERAIEGRLHRTPVVSSSTLGADVFLKAELFQKTGSFKVRGVLAKLATLSAAEKGRGVITISAGNHAQAVAWGAAAEGIDALVVMWEGASAAKVAATRGYGAAVDLEAADPTEAFARLADLQAETGRTLVHPFDDPVCQGGAGTVGLEIAQDLDGVDTVVVPTGGGGLVAGIAAAVDCRVVAAEPERSPALHAALAAGEPVPVRPDSVADGLSAPFAGTTVLDACGRYGVESVLVSEEQIRAAMRFLYERAKLACEPAAAVGVAALQAGLVGGGRTCVVVSGGNVSAPTAAAILGES